MVQSQVLIKNIPVLKSGIFGAYFMGLPGLILGVIIGIIAMFMNVGTGLILLIGTPIVMALVGFVLCALIAYGTRLGLGFSNGYQMDVENEKGTVTLKKLYVLRGAILGAFQMATLIFPFSLIGGLIMAISNIGAGLAIIIGIPILMFIFGFVFGALRTFGTSMGLSVAGGLPINIESANGKITLSGTSPLKYGIVTAVDSFIIMVVISFFLLIFALIIPNTVPQIGDPSYAMMLGNLSNVFLAAKGILLILVVLLPILGIALGFISGLLTGFGLTFACEAVKGFKVDATAQPAKITLQKLGIMQTAIFVMTFIMTYSLINLFVQGTAYLFLNNLGFALFVIFFTIIFGMIQYAIIGGITGLIAAISLNRVNGYEIEGENLDKLVGAI